MFINIEKIVGTPGNTVTLCSAIFSSTLTGNVKDRSSTTVAPTLTPIRSW